MGIFDFFKKKKEHNPYKNLPPVMQQAFAKLFPKGVADHERQVNELLHYFNNKYDFQEIDSNLIFILTGYLITGNTKSREGAITSVMHRAQNRMNKTEIEYLYEYALKNHPKLSQLLVAESVMDSLSDDGCETDTIPGGSGYFGYSPRNPIPVKGVIGIYDYLDRLYDDVGKKISYERIGTIETEVSRHPIDEYSIHSSKGNKTLFLSAYHKRTSRLAPSGFNLIDNNNIIISSSGSDFPYGYKLTDKTKSLPKLYGIGIFTCFSDSELIGKDSIFIEGEKINREAIALSNNGKWEAALEKIDIAISKGSLNAINNKFAILESHERYDEATEYLESLIDTPQETAQNLYNLAILYHNADFDSYHSLPKDIEKTYRLLVKVINLPNDSLEEYRNKVQDKASILISELEQQDNSLISIKNDIISSVKQTESPTTISSEYKIQSATPSTDIYGGKLTDRLSDIYYCIHAAAEEMAKQMVAMPEPSEEGLLELEILFAGVISHYINQHIVIQALLSGNSKFFEIEASNLGGAMEHYKNSFESQILCTQIKERTPLLEFAKKNGKLKLIDLKEPDKGGYLKAPVFVSNNNDVIICRFYFFDKDEQTSDFIIANKNYIYIDRTDEDVYLFKLKRDIDWWYDEFMKYIAYYIYASPLNYHYYLHGDKIEEGIKNIKRGKTNVVVATDINKIKACDFEETSNILPSISYALNEGIRTLDVLASSTGLIGEYNS